LHTPFCILPLESGDEFVLSDSERRGLILFEGKARCSGCHAGTNFTDESFRSNGLATNDDIGRAEVTGRDRDNKLFKVPSLRSVRLTAPYMHNGSLSTLADVVAGYNLGSPAVESIDTDIRPLELTAQEMDDLVQFLQAL
jgi:cytochrome c peroxidase